MKFRKSFLFLIILLASFQIYFGQEKPTAILFSRMGRSNCEDVGVRTSAFGFQLKDASNAQGFIVIYGKKGESYRNLRFEQFIKDVIDLMTFDRVRFTFVHGEERENLELEFWIVPTGAENPVYTEGNWNYELEVKKAFLFHENYSGPVGVCEPNSSPELYSKFLVANPNLRGNVVIYETSRGKFRQTEKRLLSELVDDNKVPRNKLKTFYVKEEFSGVEYWLVPQKKK